MNNKYYVYIHIRPDTGDIFYVGKGKNKRAWAKTDRNNHWINMVNKLKENGFNYDINIIKYFDNEVDAFNFEIETIKNIKKSNNLVNYTDGGDAPPKHFGDANPMRNKDIAAKSGLSRQGLKKTEECKKKISESRKGKGCGSINSMKRQEIKNLFIGINNPMSKYVHREKHYSNNKTRGLNNGMSGKTGDKNPMYGKPSAMRGKKNLGIAWAAANKTWQNYWGA